MHSICFFIETCACPPIIHTNFAASAPYIYRDSSGKRQGLLVDILENATRHTCSSCKNPTATVIDYVNNGKNGWAEKSSLNEVKKDIDNFVEISFPAFGSTELTSYYGFPFTPVFAHPGVVYYIIKESMNDLAIKMMSNVFGTWPIFLINILMVILSGYIVWALVSKPGWVSITLLWDRITYELGVAFERGREFQNGLFNIQSFTKVRCNQRDYALRKWIKTVKLI